MNQREKILLIVLLSAGGLWASKSLISGVLLAPINNRQTQITPLRAPIVEKQTQKERARRKTACWWACVFLCAAALSKLAARPVDSKL